MKDIYHWQHNGRNYFAIEGDPDLFFMDVVDAQLILNDQEGTENWLQFWTTSAHADIIRDLYAVQYGKPDMDIDQANKEAEIGFAETEKQLDAAFSQEFGSIDPLTIDISNALRKVNDIASNLLREHAIKSKQNPRQGDDKSSIT